MNWLSLFFMVTLTFLMFNLINYFTLDLNVKNNINSNNTLNKINNSNKIFNWKW